MFPAGRLGNSQAARPSPARTWHAHASPSLLQPGCVRCRLLPPQAPPSVSLRFCVLQTLPADAWSDPSVCFRIFSYFSFTMQALCFLAWCMPSFQVAGFSQPSSSQPRRSRPCCRGVCLPTLCPDSLLPKLHPFRSPLWRCPSVFGTNSSASG